MNKLTKCVKICLIVLLSCLSLMATAQTLSISGAVKDDTGETLPGVSIRVQGSSTGTVSSVDGSYSITVPNAQSVLEFSFIGYTTAEIVVGDRRVIDVTLKEATSALDELVVIGYGAVKKRDLTGSVVSIKSEDVTIAPTQNVMEALQGRVAGMDITLGSGRVGSGVGVLLRGTRSIYGSNSPLYIVDGVQDVQGDFDLVNPSDVESIEILKDASSTAIYGSAGANGVVLITTKRGSEGRPRVNFDAYYGFSAKPDYYKPMGRDEWVEYQREAYRYRRGSYPSENPYDMSSIITDPVILASYNDGDWIDWLSLTAGEQATSQKYNVSVSSGVGRTRIFASAGYDQETGLVKGEKQDRFTMRLNLDQEIFSWASVGFTANMNYRVRNAAGGGAVTSSMPFGKAFDERGNIIWEYSPNYYTPLGDQIPYQYVNDDRSGLTNTSAYLELRPFKGLSFNSHLYGSFQNMKHGQYWGNEARSGPPFYATGRPWANVQSYFGTRYAWDNILSYNKTIGDHSFGATAVSTWIVISEEDFTSAGGQQMLDVWSYYRLQSTASKYIDSNFKQGQKMGFAGRANYSYKGKYLLNLSGRYDGVSWLAGGNKWSFFPAVAAAWRISDESFMEASRNWLSNLKLRAGYGVTGNSGINVSVEDARTRTSLEAYITQTNGFFYVQDGLTMNGKMDNFAQYLQPYGNPDLTWEISKSTNIGIEAGFLNNRIDMTLEWYKTKTSGLLYQLATPATSGLTGWGSPMNTWVNIAATENTGVELTLNSRNFVKRKFSWDTGLTLTWGKEKVVTLPNGEDIPGESLFQGYPIRTVYSYKYDGIWGTDTPPEVLDAYKVQPGFVRIKTNPDDDGKYEHAYGTNDRMILGHRNPDYIVGLNNSFTYRDFDLSVFAMGRFGYLISSSYISSYSAPQHGAGNNIQLAGTKYWTPERQDTYLPAAGLSGLQTVGMGATSIRNGSFIKVKNITLGYTLPKNISQMAKMDRLRFYATAYNPFVMALDEQLKGTDPESNSSSFPLYTQFVFGVNITF